MTENQQQGPDTPSANELPGQAGQAAAGTPDNDNRGQVTPETLKSAMKAFKKRLKLTALDEDSNLGRGPFSSGAKGVYAIQPPNQFPREVWQELCRLGRLRDSGHGMYELVKEQQG
jgi:hypothetical protein